MAGAAKADITRAFGGITCTWPSATHNGTVICERSTGTGYTAALSTRFVLVKNGSGQVAFFRNQPTNSPGFRHSNDPRVFHTETHRSITCRWVRLPPTTEEAATCNRADGHGYLFLVGRKVVAVS